MDLPTHLSQKQKFCVDVNGHPIVHGHKNIPVQSIVERIFPSSDVLQLIGSPFYSFGYYFID
jgi:hypothetical protein